MKRVVTVTGEDGRSRVLETPALVPFRWGEIAWPVAPDDPGRTELAPGEVSWRLYTLPSSEELDAYIRERYGDDPRAGMHRTPTTDFVHVLEGRVELVLDEGSVELEAGDVVVQCGNVHAWRVLDGPVRLATVMVGVEQ